VLTLPQILDKENDEVTILPILNLAYKFIKVVNNEIRIKPLANDKGFY
jgi:hypothetical protein